MISIIEILEQTEKLIYRILLWLVLIPKTLLQVVLYPSWAPTYIKQEVGEGESRFDEYFPPVVLLLVIALVPFIIWSFLPTYGIDITSPSIDEPTQNRTLDFTSQIHFISSSSTGFTTVFWRVEQELFDGQDYSYPTVKLTKYTNNPEELRTSDVENFYQLDNNSILSFYSESFTVSGGAYWVVVEAYKADENGNVIEKYYNEVYVYVPENSEESVYVSVDRSKQPEGGYGFSWENAADILKSEGTILLALGLLIPPLLFALAAKLFTGQVLSEDTLKATFYVQCYYFSPIAFVFWATRYAIRFLTPEVFGFYHEAGALIYLPIILAVFWFMSVQTYAIAKERNIRGLWAFLIVLGCGILLVGGILYIVNVNTPPVQEGTRRTAIWVYPLIAIGLLTAYHWLVISLGRKDIRTITLQDLALLITSVLIIVSMIGFVLLSGKSLSPNTEFDDSQQSLADKAVATLTFIASLQELAQVEATQSSGGSELPPTPGDSAVTPGTPTPEPSSQATQIVEQSPDGTSTEGPAQILDTPEPVDPKFYTEGFDGNLETWPYFLTRGDESVVNFYLSNGRLFFQTIPQNDSKPWIYLVNNSYSYSNVRVETFTTNSGVNANSVSLVCEYNDAGWYEFSISNSGLYTIYAFDANEKFYYELASGGSTDINTGNSSNVLAAVCNGNKLTLIINDVFVTTITDEKFNFKEGLIGLAVSSPQGLPVSVDFDYVKVSAP